MLAQNQVGGTSSAVSSPSTSSSSQNVTDKKDKLSDKEKLNGGSTPNSQSSDIAGLGVNASNIFPANADGIQKLHTPQPFLNLILNSLEGQSHLKDSLVFSLAEQIKSIINNLIVSINLLTFHTWGIDLSSVPWMTVSLQTFEINSRLDNSRSY